MKTTATTEAVSSPLEENELWSQQWRQNTSHAGQKPRADWKNVLQIPGAGRKSRKPPTPFVGYKPNGKSQLSSILALLFIAGLFAYGIIKSKLKDAEFTEKQNELLQKKVRDLDQVGSPGLPQLPELPDSHPVFLWKTQSLPTMTREETKVKAAEHLVPLAIHKHRLLEQIIPQDNDKIDYEPWSNIFTKAWADYRLQEDHIKKSLEASQNIQKKFFCLFFSSTNRLKSNLANVRYLEQAEKSLKRVSQINDFHKVVLKADLEKLYLASSTVLRLVGIYQSYLQKSDAFYYDVKLNIGEVCDWVMERRNWLANEVQGINSNKKNKAHSTTFLKQAYNIMFLHGS